MSPLESIIYMIWRGIAIGILISAPMGPVGILCIQRTLEKGRHAGFYTGVGAAISDLFYCLLTGFGLSFIEDFIERNQNVIQLVGSIVLIIFSIYLFRKDPSSPLRRPVPQNVSIRKNILGGFLFTFSNPLIIFLIIGLFARFNFTAPEIKGAYYAIGYIFIVGGALAWWYGITFAIEKVRSRFNMKAMKLMNIAIGIVILIFACFGMVTSISGLVTPAKAEATVTHYIHPSPGTITDTITRENPLQILNVKEPLPLTLDFKIRPLGMKGSLRSVDTELFTLQLISHSVSSEADILKLAVLSMEHSPTPLSSQQAIRCDASLPGGFFISSSEPLADNMHSPSGWCHYRLTLSSAVGLCFQAGTTRLQPLLRIQPTDLSMPGDIESINLIPGPKHPVEIRDIRLRVPATPDISLTDAKEALDAVTLSKDLTEGLWGIFDWSMDMKKARQGGDYRLLTVKAPDGHYDIYYMEGAEILSAEWRPGMVKGKLFPTGTPCVYRLEWIDAEGNTLKGSQRAQLIPDQQIMTLYFPFLETEIRLRKIEIE